MVKKIVWFWPLLGVACICNCKRCRRIPLVASVLLAFCMKMGWTLPDCKLPCRYTSLYYLAAGRICSGCLLQRNLCVLRRCCSFNHTVGLWDGDCFSSVFYSIVPIGLVIL